MEFYYALAFGTSTQTKMYPTGPLQKSLPLTANYGPGHLPDIIGGSSNLVRTRVTQNKPPGEMGTSLIRLGFQEDAKLAEFLARPEQEMIQKKFDIVFPPQAKPKFASASAGPVASQVAVQESGAEELDLGSDLELGSSEEISMSDDKDLELSIDDASLALGSDDSLSQTAPLDEGMDLDFAGDLDLGGDLISEDSDEATSLKLGDDVELGGDVLAKLAEIDEIMEADATSASIHPSTLSALDPSDLSLSDEDTVGSSVFLGGDLDSSSDDELVLGDGDVLGGMDLDADEIEETRVAPLPTAKPAAKKSPPIAPSLESDEVGEELSFGTNANELEVPKKVASSSERSPEERSGYEDVKGHYNHELERLQATLNHLRTDRSELLKKIEELEEYKIGHSRQTLGMRAELDEKKIEVQLLKRRLSEESSDLKYQLDLETERRKLAEERAKAYQAEVAAVQQKVKLEVKKVSSREKELEQKLELLKTDAESQIRHRDQKILELKRRMDAMEFDMDAMNAIEQKTVGDKHELESKLDKAIKTLRTAIGILETDDPKLATLEKLKKNLEV